MTSRHIVILAHGSVNPEWNAPVEALVRGAAEGLPGSHVALAWLQHGQPTLLEAVRGAARQGAAAVAVLPLFLGMGGHVTKNIPALAREAQEECGIPVTVLPAVGQTPEFADMLRQLLVRCAGGLPH